MQSVKSILLAACCVCTDLSLIEIATAQEPVIVEVKLPEVQDELSRRVKTDQKARFRLIEESPAMDSDARKQIISQLQVIDEDNTKWIKSQIQKHGWLGHTLVGKEGAHNAWLLVQHADRNPKFQVHCLKLMQAMPEGEVSGQDLAYLTDRTLTAAGKPQRYGTQCSVKDGKASVNEVENPEQLDERRKQVGLQPIAEYLKFVESMYGKDK